MTVKPVASERFGVFDLALPRELTERIQEFLLDKRTGNVRLNIRDGEILGFHIEEIITVKS